MKQPEASDFNRIRDSVFLAAAVGFASGLSEGYRRGRQASLAAIQEQVTVMRAQGQIIVPSEISRAHHRAVAVSMARTSAKWLVVVPAFAAVYGSLSLGLACVRDGRDDELNGAMAGALCGAAVGVRLRPVAAWTAAGAAIGCAASLFARLSRYFERVLRDERERNQKQQR